MHAEDEPKQGDQGAPLLVFVHGFSGDQSDWDAQVAHFSPRFETLAIDLPGHGARSAPTDASVESLAADLCAQVAADGVRPLVLIGHSLGCRVILEAFASLRGRIAAMVLIDDHSLAGKDSVRAAEHFEAAVAAVGFAAMIEPAFANMFGPGSDPALRDRIVARARAIDPAFAVALIAGGTRWEARVPEILATIDVPVLILQCTNLDEELNWAFLAPGQKPDWIGAVEKRVPTAHIELLSGPGHFVQIEAPDRVNRLIKSFLESLPIGALASGEARRG